MKVKFRLKKSFQANYMKLREWSVKDLAEKMEYTKQQVSQTLSGSVEPTMNFVRRLCALTGLRADELVETIFEK